LEGGALVTVTICWSLFVGSVVEVAVMVTVPPVGGVLGAVYPVAAPLAVCAGEKVPQAPALPHVTVQSTPALAESLLTAATKFALAFSMIVLLVIPPVIFTETGAMMFKLTEVRRLVPVAVA
jgi:hypothetical protein